MLLSQHFSLEEMTLSQEAARKGLSNQPTPRALENLKRITATLEEIRTLVGKPINISSGYRSPAVNAAVGGAAKSAHVLGLAADINVGGLTPQALARIIRASGIKYDQLILEFDRWVHIGLDENQCRNQCLTIRTGTGYLPGIV